MKIAKIYISYVSAKGKNVAGCVVFNPTNNRIYKFATAAEDNETYLYRENKVVLTAIIIRVLSDLQEVLFSVGNSFFIVIFVTRFRYYYYLCISNKISKKNGTNQEEDLPKGQAVGQNPI